MIQLTPNFSPTGETRDAAEQADFLRTLILEEAERSAIPSELALLNMRPVWGDCAIEALTEHAIEQVQRVTSYATEPAKRLLSRYEFAAAGGWVAYGSTMEGDRAEVAYFKPIAPRLDFERRKSIKYESPAKAEALPLLPFVDEATSAAIYQRYGVEPGEGESFWRVVWRCNLPIGITEGFKKAQSLTAHGLPTIAIRGITQWHKKGTNELHDILAQFAAAKRRVYVIFDEDTKPVTRADVQRQRMKLAAALEQAGCIVGLPSWDGQALGKGIDDVLYGLGDGRQAWLDALLRDAPTPKSLRWSDRKRRALDVLERLNRLSFPVERSSEGEYLPKLPALQRGAIHVLSAPMNAGKTTRIGADWLGDARSVGWFVIVLSPLNSLGEQAAESWGLPHIHHYSQAAEQQAALWHEAEQSGGVVMCLESLHRLPAWIFDRPLLLVMDEANQIVGTATAGDTLKSRWAEQLERFAAVARHAAETGAIVLSEAGIPDRAVRFVEALSGAAMVRVFRHRKQAEPWDCRVFRGRMSGFRAALLSVAGDGRRRLLTTTSQREAKRIERALRRQHPHLKITRIDSETNQGGQFAEFFRSPDAWLEEHKPDVLLLSPSAKSGVSIQGGIAAADAYFAEVWGCFPALSTDSQMQLLGRFRPAVPRIIFCPDFLPSGPDEELLYPRAIKRRLESNARQIAGVYGLDELLSAADERADAMAAIETAVMDYLAAETAVAGAQKLMAHDALVAALERAGHAVASEAMPHDRSSAALWKEIDEELWREDAAAIAAAVVERKHDRQWARRVLDSQDAGTAARIRAHKVLWRDEFPGVAFDDAEECYQALCRDYGAMRRGVQLQARAENLEAAKAHDRAAAEAILSKGIRALHRLPKAAIRAALIARTGILALLDGTTYHNRDERAIAIKAAALRFAAEIAYYLRLQVSESQSPVEIANKLIKKLGLEARAIARPGKRGHQHDRHYQVVGWDCPIRSRLLEAMRRKLSAPVSTICKEQSDYLQIVDTPPDSPPEQGDPWLTQESLADVRDMWQAADDDVARAELRRIIPPAALWRAIAS